MKPYKKVKCENCARFSHHENSGRCWIQGCMGDGWRLEELDPADLEKLDAGYYKLVEELRETIRDMLRHIDRQSYEAGYDCNAILNKIADLESGLSIPKAVIEAAAWKMLYQSRGETPEKRAFVKEMKKVMKTIYALVADLEAGRDTGKGGKTK